MVRHLAYELALAARNVSLADPAAVGRMLYDLAHGR